MCACAESQPALALPVEAIVVAGCARLREVRDAARFLAFLKTQRQRDRTVRIEPRRPERIVKLNRRKRRRCDGSFS